MFEHTWSLQVPMTLEACSVLGRGGAQRAVQGAAVHVVAIGTFDQTFIHSMAERLAEIGLLLGVAAVAELWLLLDQQLRASFAKWGEWQEMQLTPLSA